jgi:hypothetical protein
MITPKTKTIETTKNRSSRSQNTHSPEDRMEAIANGVQARLEETTSFSRKVTDDTVKTARALGINEAVIERWAARRLYRLAEEAERLREIRSILGKVYHERIDTTAG